MREESSRDRSLSKDGEVRSIDSFYFHSSQLDRIKDSDGENLGPGKPGRKKNPKYVPDLKYPHLKHSYFLNSTQAARRDQNRIAQREFRLRKQQRVCTFIIVPVFCLRCVLDS
jgi:hypothetical protein